MKVFINTFIHEVYNYCVEVITRVSGKSTAPSNATDVIRDPKVNRLTFDITSDSSYLGG